MSVREIQILLRVLQRAVPEKEEQETVLSLVDRLQLFLRL
jgi:hypothetical protein